MVLGFDPGAHNTLTTTTTKSESTFYTNKSIGLPARSNFVGQSLCKQICVNTQCIRHDHIRVSFIFAPSSSINHLINSIEFSSIIIIFHSRSTFRPNYSKFDTFYPKYSTIPYFHNFCLYPYPGEVIIF